MSNAFTSLPVPIGVGVGTSVNVSTFEANKTIQVQGSFYISAVAIEASLDGVSWDSIALFQGAGGIKAISCVTKYMRVRVSGVAVGSDVIVTVGGTSGTCSFLPVTVPLSNGTGVPTDISTFGQIVTVQVKGIFATPILVTMEVSQDNVSWASVAAYQGEGIQTFSVVAHYLRVQVSGRTSSTPFVGVGVIVGLGTLQSQGPVGPQGPPGTPGAKGDKGDTGAAGSPGPKGDTGATGPKGDKGDKGDTGAAGSPGPKGDTGATGPKGDKGDKGDTGAAGPKGDTGAKGDKGDKGDTGDTGPQGPQGDPGPAGPSGDTYYVITDYGASTGSADNQAAIQSCINAAAVVGGRVWVPAGVFIVGRSGSNLWCLELPSNVTIEGIKGASWIQMKAGMPSSPPIVLFYSNVKQNVRIDGLGFDGNWGATIGVTNSLNGINQGTQTDPHNHLLMLRGCDNVRVQNCLFQQSYGDFIWIGYSADGVTPGTNHTFSDCYGIVSARNGTTIGSVDGIYQDRCSWNCIYAQAFDSEPVDTFCRNVYLNDSFYDLWWDPANPAREINSPISVVGGSVSFPAESNLARTWRITNCSIVGSVIIMTARDITLRSCKIFCNFSGYSKAPVLVEGWADDITLDDLEIYDRTTSVLASTHIAAIEIRDYAGGTTVLQPLNVNVLNCKIRAKNGRQGIYVAGTGGRAYNGAGGQKSLADETGTATAVTATVVTDPSKSWIVDQWIGWNVRIGSAVGVVQSNTATQLTIFTAAFGPSWMTPTGEATATPSPGAYSITGASGVVTLENNMVDCGDDGNGAGSYGIHVYAERYGMRVRLLDNKVKNCATYGYVIEGVDAARAFKFIELGNNYGWDDQLTPTMSTLLRYINPAYITQHVLYNNVKGDGVTLATSGLTSGVWLVADGPVQQWQGFGSPSFTAPKGSTFTRLDGTAGTLQYVNTNGSTSWSAYA